MEKLNITFCSYPDFSGNAKALYDYMKDRYKENMNYVWAVNSKEAKEMLEKNNILAYVIGTKEYYDEMKKTDIFFTTHANILGEKNDKALYVELWHGISPKQQGYIAENLSDSDKMFYYSIKEKVDYMVVPSEFWRVIFATRFNIEYPRVLGIGYPKLDFMVKGNAKENLNTVLGIDTSKYAKVLYYMPTFRLGCGRRQESKINADNVINIKPYDEEKLNNYLRENNYLLCIKKHPSEELELKEIETDNIKVIKEEKIQENGLTVNEILDAADVMISDYSSLGVEFLFLNKPVIYLTNDIDDYLKNRGFAFDNVDFWMASYQVKDYDELIQAIEDSVKPNFKYKKALAEKRELWFRDLKNGGCDKICDYFFKDNKINEEVIAKKENANSFLDTKIKELETTIDEKNEVICQREARIKELDDFIANIINSKGWQFLEKMRKIKKLGRK